MPTRMKKMTKRMMKSMITSIFRDRMSLYFAVGLGRAFLLAGKVVPACVQKGCQRQHRIVERIIFVIVQLHCRCVAL